MNGDDPIEWHESLRYGAPAPPPFVDVDGDRTHLDVSANGTTSSQGVYVEAQVVGGSAPATAAAAVIGKVTVDIDGQMTTLTMVREDKVPYTPPKPRTVKGKKVPPPPDPNLWVWTWVCGDQSGSFVASETDGPLRAARRALTDLIVQLHVGFDLTAVA